MKKMLGITTFLLMMFYFAEWLIMPVHPAFLSWKEYCYYFKRIAYHGVSIVERDKGVSYFYDKKGRRCKL